MINQSVDDDSAVTGCQFWHRYAEIAKFFIKLLKNFLTLQLINFQLTQHDEYFEFFHSVDIDRKINSDVLFSSCNCARLAFLPLPNHCSC